MTRYITPLFSPTQQGMCAKKQQQNPHPTESMRHRTDSLLITAKIPTEIPTEVMPKLL